MVFKMEWMNNRAVVIIYSESGCEDDKRHEVSWRKARSGDFLVCLYVNDEEKLGIACLEAVRKELGVVGQERCRREG